MNGRTAAVLAVLACPGAQGAQGAPEVSLEGVAGVLYADRTVAFEDAKLIDQGGDALAAGGRLGWLWGRPGRWVWGVEAEALGLDGRSRVNASGLFDSRRWHALFGGYARVGLATPDGSLLYLRAGLQHWIATAEAVAGPGRDADYTVPAIGIGAQIPLFRRAYVRVDWVYSAAGILDEQGLTTVAAGWSW